MRAAPEAPTTAPNLHPSATTDFNPSIATYVVRGEWPYHFDLEIVRQSSRAPSAEEASPQTTPQKNKTSTVAHYSPKDFDKATHHPSLPHTSPSALRHPNKRASKEKYLLTCSIKILPELPKNSDPFDPLICFSEEILRKPLVAIANEIESVIQSTVFEHPSDYKNLPRVLLEKMHNVFQRFKGTFSHDSSKMKRYTDELFTGFENFASKVEESNILHFEPLNHKTLSTLNQAFLAEIEDVSSAFLNDFARLLNKDYYCYLGSLAKTFSLSTTKNFDELKLRLEQSQHPHKQKHLGIIAAIDFKELDHYSLAVQTDKASFYRYIIRDRAIIIRENNFARADTESGSYQNDHITSYCAIRLATSSTVPATSHYRSLAPITLRNVELITTPIDAIELRSAKSHDDKNLKESLIRTHQSLNEFHPDYHQHQKLIEYRLMSTTAKQLCKILDECLVFLNATKSITTKSQNKYDPTSGARNELDAFVFFTNQHRWVAHRDVGDFPALNVYRNLLSETATKEDKIKFLAQCTAQLFDLPLYRSYESKLSPQSLPIKTHTAIKLSKLSILRHLRITGSFLAPILRDVFNIPDSGYNSAQHSSSIFAFYNNFMSELLEQGSLRANVSGTSPSQTSDLVLQAVTAELNSVKYKSDAVQTLKSAINQYCSFLRDLPRTTAPQSQHTENDTNPTERPRRARSEDNNDEELMQKRLRPEQPPTRSPKKISAPLETHEVNTERTSPLLLGPSPKKPH